MVGCIAYDCCLRVFGLSGLLVLRFGWRLLRLGGCVLVFGGLFVFGCVVYMIVLGGVCLVWVFGDWLFGLCWDWLFR